MATLAKAFASEPVSSVPVVPGLPLVGNLLQFRSNMIDLLDDAARIGPVARVQLANIPLYVIADAEVAHELFVERASSFEKSDGINFMRPVLGNGLILAEGDTWKRHRKLLAPAFAPKRLAAYGDVMVEETRRQIRDWRQGQRLDAAEEMMEMTLAIAGRTLFGADIRSDATTVAEGLELGMRSQRASLRSVVRLGYEWPLPRHLQMRKAVKILDEVVYRLIAEGRKRGTDRGDVLSILLLARDDDGHGLTDQEVRDEVMTLLLAGHETTANALTWAWYELARNPDALGALTAELHHVGKRMLTADDLPTLPYTLAVLEEAMRLHPPAYVVGRQATEDVELGGHHFPKGAIVLVNIRGLHRRSDYYPRPYAFDPSRMLPDAKKRRPRHHYMPFGAGPRVCIGSHFALLEGHLALATIAQHATLRLATTRVYPEPLITLRPRGGMPVTVELR